MQNTEEQDNPKARQHAATQPSRASLAVLGPHLRQPNADRERKRIECM